ncbi:homoserine O-acetyltransferase [Streptomyces durmitorensis]|uniref:Homoserine O-acetyltransferase n=1 Tax=Streptomyces durmitorensis TaxID=319947 RepID=A0ABY4Q5D1_9ACTN|nr:homoserine O-acetyltransferase [Streptomyces durmitorensis]UQT61403.1 homoserine O-acetyltransferase [Streptomyces durmitorensis]
MPVGRRKWADLPAPLELEGGGVLPDVRLAYETWGTLAPDASNAVLVLHGLTGDSHAGGPAMAGHPTAGWWEALIGPGRPLDTDRWFVVAPNVLGGCQGSTGPATTAWHGRPWGSRFPDVTIRDQVAAEAALADVLGIGTWAAVVGGSMGGMRALEWAVSRPDRLRTLGLLACPVAATADQIAWSVPQLHAIRSDPNWRGGDYHGAPVGGGPHRGLGNARRIAHITYRGGAELEERFGRRLERSAPARGRPTAAATATATALTTTAGHAGDARYAVESYLDHHAEKLVHRFDAGSYVALTEAMNRHDIGRGRGGVEAALRRVRADGAVIAISSDRLFPAHEQRRIARGLPHCAHFSVIDSPAGHDGFLIEHEQVGAVLRQALR